MDYLSSSYISLLIVIPDSVSKTLNIEALHTILVLFLPVVLLLHLHLLLLLSLSHGSLVVVHLVIHVVLSAFTLDWVLLIKLVQQLHKHLIVVVESLRLDLLPPGVIVPLHVV